MWMLVHVYIITLKLHMHLKLGVANTTQTLLPRQKVQNTCCIRLQGPLISVWVMCSLTDIHNNWPKYTMWFSPLTTNIPSRIYSVQYNMTMLFTHITEAGTWYSQMTAVTGKLSSPNWLEEVTWSIASCNLQNLEQCASFFVFFLQLLGVSVSPLGVLISPCKFHLHNAIMQLAISGWELQENAACVNGLNTNGL